MQIRHDRFDELNGKRVIDTDWEKERERTTRRDVETSLSVNGSVAAHAMANRNNTRAEALRPERLCKRPKTQFNNAWLSTALRRVPREHRTHRATIDSTTYTLGNVTSSLTKERKKERKLIKLIGFKSNRLRLA
jgi:hypothetical protein